MGKKSNFNKIGAQIDALVAQENIPDKYEMILKVFFKSYVEVITAHNANLELCISVFADFLTLIEKQFTSPYQFELYHERMRRPYDYYQFGISFLRPLVDMPYSTLKGIETIEQIIKELERGENVILIANHQVEAEPMAISLMLEPKFPQLSEKLIFVAGTRVTSDPLAIPFSMGCNLLCIHSKKYIDTPPEQQHEKQMHNKRTMEKMVELLSNGGHAIYVAPSGGRDRMNEAGEVEVAPFDPQSIEMFYLMTKKAKRPTHFYTLSLSTYHLLPPPETSETELGETRVTHGGAIHLSFGEKVDMENFPGSELVSDKHEKRKTRAKYLWNRVKQEYATLPR